MHHIHAGNMPQTLNWQGAVNAIRAGHHRPKAILKDIFIEGQNILLSRAAFIEGLGWGVKSVTVVPDNIQRDLPSIHGVMVVFDPETGQPKASIDSAILTNLKTVADSLLGALCLANPNSKTLLIVGAGSVAESLVEGYSALFPALETIKIYNRTPARAQQLIDKFQGKVSAALSLCENLEEGVCSADIISAATMAKEPILKGEWARVGQHYDLIGAFNAVMREADDLLMQKAFLTVDSYDSTLDHIGELKIALQNQVIKKEDVKADLYALCAQSHDDKFVQASDIDKPTLFKNGGGAHLDLMIADYILSEL